ncbi:MAG: L-fuculose-phosphate aldolase [Tissierellia bacterium]|nr:L-fuculose-phosphate aldolase [Tissierellia bacterium]
MMYLKERQEIIDYGIKMLEMGLTKGTGGNLSVFVRDKGHMLISPSGIEYHKIKPEDIVVMDLDGNIISGDKKPSSEHEMHSIVYKTRDDIDAVIHTHTIHCAAVSCMNVDLPAVHYMIAVAGGKNVRCAKYATFGTPELAKNAIEAMKDRKAVLLANHGLLAGAKDLANALNITDEIEFVAQLYLMTKAAGEPVILPDEEMDLMLGRFASYGQIKSDKK